MTFKLGRTFYFILIICTLLWNQQAAFLTQKIALENSYRDKVISAVSRLLGQENFIVIVNVEFSTVGGRLKKTPTPQASQGPSNSYTPIPGLPTVPSRDKSVLGTKQNGSQMSENNYSIGRIEVNINLNEKLATGSNKQEIKSLVEKIIPETRACEDCIKIESVGFFQSEKSKEMEALKNEIEELKSSQRNAEEGILKKELKDVEDRLDNLQRDKEISDEKIKLRDLELERRDSLAHSRLVEFEKLRTIQDSIRNANTEVELRQIRNNKMNSDSTLLSKTMSIVEKQVDSKKEDSLIGGSGIMGSVIFILLIICLMIVTFIAARNKTPKPIFLKPKTKHTKNNASETSEEKPENTSSTAEPTSSAIMHDEDAVRSELRSLRQTAVSLTVSEKEGAAALIKEWLEDNPNKGENPVEE